MRVLYDNCQEGQVFENGFRGWGPVQDPEAARGLVASCAEQFGQTLVGLPKPYFWYLQDAMKDLKSSLQKEEAGVAPKTSTKHEKSTSRKRSEATSVEKGVDSEPEPVELDPADFDDKESEDSENDAEEKEEEKPGDESSDDDLWQDKYQKKDAEKPQDPWAGLPAKLKKQASELIEEAVLQTVPRDFALWLALHEPCPCNLQFELRLNGEPFQEKNPKVRFEPVPEDPPQGAAPYDGHST